MQCGESGVKADGACAATCTLDRQLSPLRPTLPWEGARLLLSRTVLQAATTVQPGWPKSQIYLSEIGFIFHSFLRGYILIQN